MSSNEFMINQLSIGISGSSLINFKINLELPTERIVKYESSSSYGRRLEKWLKSLPSSNHLHESDLATEELTLIDESNFLIDDPPTMLESILLPPLTLC